MIYDVKYLEEADKKNSSPLFQKLGSILQFENTMGGIYKFSSRKYEAFLPSESEKSDSNMHVIFTQILV